MPTSPAVDLGTGITITFGTSAFSAQIIDVTPPGDHREAINTSHMATTLNHTFMPSDLNDPGELRMTIHYKPDTTIPVNAAAETITIRWPSGNNKSFSGFVTDVAPRAPFENKMTADITVKVSGAKSDGTGTGTGS